MLLPFLYEYFLKSPKSRFKDYTLNPASKGMSDIKARAYYDSIDPAYYFAFKVTDNALNEIKKNRVFKESTNEFHRTIFQTNGVSTRIRMITSLTYGSLGMKIT